MSDAARAVLLAEALGDIRTLHLEVERLGQQVRGLAQAVDGRAQYAEVLSQKMEEFRHFQIPERAAATLQAHAQVFLRALMGDLKVRMASEAWAMAGRLKFWYGAALVVFGFALGLLVGQLV